MELGHNEIQSCIAQLENLKTISLFQGIEMAFLSLTGDKLYVHHKESERIIVINYCKTGRIGWKMGNGNYVYPVSYTHLFFSPTYFIFGKGTENETGKYVKRFNGNKVLLHYGGGSIKKSGLYYRVMNCLKESGIEVVTLGGVRPNPVSYTHLLQQLSQDWH